MKKLVIALLYLALLPTLLSSQKHVDLGIMLGMSSHGSDAASWGRHGLGFLENTKLAYGLNVSYSLNPKLGIRLQYRGTEIEGDDSDLVDKAEWGPQHVIRDYMYRSQISEFALQVEYRFQNLFYDDNTIINRNKNQLLIYPYLMGGIGYASVTDDENMRDWGNPHPSRMNDVLLDQEQGSTGGIQFPMGLGIRMEISEYIWTDLFYNLRLPVSDYLDGISEAANPDKNDAYQLCGINIGFRLQVESADSDGDGIPDSQDECPEVPGSRLLFGCPDFDGDGIMDSYDNCPQVAGPAKTYGCPDNDEDGVPDHLDDCPNKKGLITNKGCPESSGRRP